MVLAHLRRLAVDSHQAVSCSLHHLQDTLLSLYQVYGYTLSLCGPVSICCCVPYQVYKGRKRYTGQMAALKFINKKGKGAKEVTSLRQEMNILCTLEHENIIRWLEHFETDTDFVVVTELAQGALRTLSCLVVRTTIEQDLRTADVAANPVAPGLGDRCMGADLAIQWLMPITPPTLHCTSALWPAGELFHVLDTDKRLPEKIVKDIARQLVQALWYLHTRRIIHRDMKPQVSAAFSRH